jgi:hypothetical protein
MGLVFTGSSNENAVNLRQLYTVAFFGLRKGFAAQALTLSHRIHGEAFLPIKSLNH